MWGGVRWGGVVCVGLMSDIFLQWCPSIWSLPAGGWVERGQTLPLSVWPIGKWTCTLHVCGEWWNTASQEALVPLQVEQWNCLVQDYKACLGKLFPRLCSERYETRFSNAQGAIQVCQPWGKESAGTHGKVALIHREPLLLLLHSWVHGTRLIQSYVLVCVGGGGCQLK